MSNIQKHRTQLEQAQALLRQPVASAFGTFTRDEVSVIFRSLHAQWDEFRRLVDLAQNAAPLGFADGSITEVQWNALRNLTDALYALRSALLAARQECGL